MKNLTISKKITIAVIPVVLGCLVLFGVTSYVYMSQIIKGDLSSNILKAVKEKNNMIDVWIKTHLLEVESIAQTPAARNINKGFDEIDAVNRNRYTYFKKTYPNDYSDIYSANKEGTYHTIRQNIDNTLFSFEGNIKTRDYFQNLMNGTPYEVTNPLVSKTTGKPTIFMVAAIKNDQGVPQGLVGAGIQLNFISDAIKNLSIGKSSYGLALAKDGTFMVHPNKDFEMKKKITEVADNKLINMYNYMKKNNSGIFEYRFNNKDRIAFFSTVRTTGWITAVVLEKDVLFEKIYTIRKLMGGLAVLSIFLVTAAIFIIGRIIVKPVNQVVAGLKDIAEGEGDLTMRLNVTSNDEIGEVAKLFNRFIEKLHEIISQLAAEAVNVGESSKDLTVTSKDMTKGAEETSSQADNVSTAAEEMSSNMSNVVKAIEESSNSANIIASAAEQMNSTINEIAENSEKTRRISEDAAQKTVKAGEMMKNLNDAAISISQITETISEISEQTNLLALNATIEAARAGESGKGFAVVAGEIKMLASQTAEATLNIKEKIDNIQSVSNTSIASMNEVIEVINNAKNMVSIIAVAVSEQSSTTQEISRNIEQLSSRIYGVNDNIGQSSKVANHISQEIALVNHASRNMLNNSASIKGSAEKLNQMADKLTGIVEKFIIHKNLN